MNQTHTYRIFYPTPKNVHSTQQLKEASLKETIYETENTSSEKNEITSCTLSDHKTIRLKINSRKSLVIT